MNWYLLYYKPRQHKEVKRHLDAVKIEYYMPVSVVLVPRADHLNSVRKYIRPVFPGYIFLRFDIETIHTTTLLKHIPCAVNFVKFGNQLRPIPDEVIAGLRLNLSTCSTEINSIPVILCENWDISLLYEAVESFNALSKNPIDDENDLLLIKIIEKMINRPDCKRNTISEEDLKKWLDVLVSQKQCT